jgi:hypothetical protein
VSQGAVDFGGETREIKDSYEEQSLSNGSGRIRVEVPVDPAFDREAYAKVIVASSQPSQATQPSQRSQSCRPSYARLTQFKTRKARPFLWDEEEDGVPIIPDSQELAGSSAYKPTETPTSNTKLTTSPYTGTNTEADFATWRSSFSVGSARIDYRHSEPPSYPTRASNFKDKSETTSSQVDRSVQPTIDGRYFSISLEESQEGQSLPQSSVSEPEEDPILLASSRARPETSISAESPHLPSSSENHSPSLARGTKSPEADHLLSQVPARQPSSSEVDHGSQLQFQPQLPAASRDENSSQNTNLHVRQG